MANHAQRFMIMVRSFDWIMRYYEREVPPRARQADFPVHPRAAEHVPYLKIHLRSWVDHYQTQTIVNRSGTNCVCLVRNQNDDGRRPLPNAIVRCLRDCNCRWQQDRVTVTWVIAYLHRKFPPYYMPNNSWRDYQLSHRCLGANQNQYCLVADHLVWESAATNQSRGYRICMAICHCGCGMTICEANQIHTRCCI